MLLSVNLLFLAVLAVLGHFWLAGGEISVDFGFLVDLDCAS